MMNTTVRQPAVAGHFYSRDPQALTRDLRSFFSPPEQKMKALGCVVPHAGYIYSGHVAGSVYAAIELPRRFIILGPNHTGRGSPLAIMSSGAWQTPLGAAPIDSPLADQLRVACPYLEEDAVAHRGEHAIEVQLPFLQVAMPEFSFVPISVGTTRYEVLHALGEGLAGMLSEEREKVLLISSSDMNHYEDDSTTREKDRKAIEKVLALDPRGLYDVVLSEAITMCGFCPTVVMLVASKCLGATSTKLVKYATSGDISGDRSSVVGYAGIVIQ